jgi:hypothetical protein
MNIKERFLNKTDNFSVHSVKKFLNTPSFLLFHKEKIVFNGKNSNISQTKIKVNNYIFENVCKINENILERERDVK